MLENAAREASYTSTARFVGPHLIVLNVQFGKKNRVIHTSRKFDRLLLRDFPDMTAGVDETGSSYTPRPIHRAIQQYDAACG